MNTITTNTNVIAKLASELREDLGVIYGMGVKNPHEPDAEKARILAESVAAPWQLLRLAKQANVAVHLKMDVPEDRDVVAAVTAAFYARVRAPTWLSHPEAVANVATASKTVEGRVLATAAQTLAQALVASGFTGNFQGSPSEVADAIRSYLEGTS